MKEQKKEKAEEGKFYPLQEVRIFLLIMTDVKRIGAFANMVKELDGAGIRINQETPKVLVEKKVEGDLDIFSNLKQEIDKETD